MVNNNNSSSNNNSNLQKSYWGLGEVVSVEPGRGTLADLMRFQETEDK